ncbi:MAG: HNH endonuclease [Verrucomicrobiota bacterium]|nr:HNH endonuclease [Verrucomicrobiota bacterium]
MKNQIKFVAFIIALGLAATSYARDAMLPDPKLTPGKVAPLHTPRPGVTEAMERKVFERYRIPWSRHAEFKVDHLIPVELGGADSIDNLWPQSLSIKPYGAKRKEYLTDRLLALVASGQMTLKQAQQEISKDWIDAFIDHFGLVYLR